MAEYVFNLEVQVETLRRADGLVFGSRIVWANVPCLVDRWYWINRETDELEELVLYRVGIAKGQQGCG